MLGNHVKQFLLQLRSLGLCGRRFWLLHLEILPYSLYVAAAGRSRYLTIPADNFAKTKKHSENHLFRFVVRQISFSFVLVHPGTSPLLQLGAISSSKAGPAANFYRFHRVVGQNVVLWSRSQCLPGAPPLDRDGARSSCAR